MEFLEQLSDYKLRYATMVLHHGVGSINVNGKLFAHHYQLCFLGGPRHKTDEDMQGQRTETT
jgi:hypothetical protein